MSGLVVGSVSNDGRSEVTHTAIAHEDEDAVHAQMSEDDIGHAFQEVLDRNEGANSLRQLINDVPGVNDLGGFR